MPVQIPGTNWTGYWTGTKLARAKQNADKNVSAERHGFETPREFIFMLKYEDLKEDSSYELVPRVALQLEIAIP